MKKLTGRSTTMELLEEINNVVEIENIEKIESDFEEQILSNDVIALIQKLKEFSTVSYDDENYVVYFETMNNQEILIAVDVEEGQTAIKLEKLI